MYYIGMSKIDWLESRFNRKAKKVSFVLFLRELPPRSYVKMHHVPAVVIYGPPEECELRGSGDYHPDLFYSTGTRYRIKQLNISVSWQLSN